MDENLWSSDENSQLFRQHMEDEIHSCQSGQQLILDLVRATVRPADRLAVHFLHHISPARHGLRRRYVSHAITSHSVQVKKLGVQLTSTDASLRYKGTALLAKVRHYAH